MKSISTFVEEQGIEMDYDVVDENPNMSDMPSGSMHFKCEFVKTDADDVREMIVYFSMGPLTSCSPTAEEVLDCIASDSSGFDNTRSFEEWCGDYGYDSDSRKALRIYETVERQHDMLLGFLDDDAFQELLYETERM